MKVFLALALLVAVQASDDWEAYKAAHNKQYSSPEEEAERKAIFESNLEKVRSHNSKRAFGGATYRTTVNEFADMTPEEFSARMNGLEVGGTEGSIPHSAKSTRALPLALDWRTLGAVTPVKNQGQCGSCWSFSTTGAMEGAYKIAKGTLLSFSEQQLVDCSGAYGNKACNGGWMNSAFNYIKTYGIEQGSDYPYKAALGTCQYNASKVVTKLTSYSTVASGSETDLMTAVALKPVSVAVDATPWQLYSGGVFNDTSCTTNINHGVLVVGYGTTTTGVPYWIVKNSWGTGWGEGGYIRVIRGYNRCAIASYASYPNI